MRFNSRNNTDCSGNMGSADIDKKSVFDFYDLKDSKDAPSTSTTTSLHGGRCLAGCLVHRMYEFT
jgi:hypothetical protein